MNLRPRIADVYLARTVLVAALATWAVLLGFDLMTALYNELDEVGEGGYTLSHAVLYTVYTVPRRLYELFPTAALIGCVLGLGGLSARSELTAMRAVGMSRLRIGLGFWWSLWERERRTWHDLASGTVLVRLAPPQA